jgi:hypothetical protein
MQMALSPLLSCFSLHCRYNKRKAWKKAVFYGFQPVEKSRKQDFWVILPFMATVEYRVLFSPFTWLDDPAIKILLTCSLHYHVSNQISKQSVP